MVSPLRQSSQEALQLTPLNVQSAREAGSIGQSLQQGLQVGQNFAINAQQNARASQDQLFREWLAQRQDARDQESLSLHGRQVEQGLSLNAQQNARASEQAALQARQAQVQTAVEEQRLAELQKRYMFLDTHLSMEAKKSAVELQVAEAQLRMQGIQEQLAKSRGTYEEVQIQKTVSDIDPWQDENGDWHMVRAEPGGGVRSPIVDPSHPRVQRVLMKQQEDAAYQKARTAWMNERNRGPAESTSADLAHYRALMADEVARRERMDEPGSGASDMDKQSSDERIRKLNDLIGSGIDRASQRYGVQQIDPEMAQQFAERIKGVLPFWTSGGSAPEAPAASPSRPAEGGTARRPDDLSPLSQGPVEDYTPGNRRQAAQWGIAAKASQTATSLGISAESLGAILPRFVQLMRASGKDRDPVTDERQSDETIAIRLMDRLAGDGPDAQALRSMFLKAAGK